MDEKTKKVLFGDNGIKYQISILDDYFIRWTRDQYNDKEFTIQLYETIEGLNRLIKEIEPKKSLKKGE